MKHDIACQSLPINRSTRAKLLDRERRDAALIAEFMRSTDPVQHALANRLERCADERAAHAGWRAQRDPNDPNANSPAWSCKTVACAACRRRHHVRPYRTRVFDAWNVVNPDNENCSLVTIHLGLFSDPSDVRSEVFRHRRDWRNLRTSRPAWKDFKIDGLTEVDTMHAYEGRLLLPDRVALFRCLPVIGSGGTGLTWLPHVHLAVHHLGVERGDLEDVLISKWKGPYRVDVEPFDPSKTAPDNAADVTGYAGKNRCSTRIGNEMETWAVSARATWWTVLRKWNRGLEPLRVTMGPIGVRDGLPSRRGALSLRLAHARGEAAAPG